jgi:hypothetical protein
MGGQAGQMVVRWWSGGGQMQYNRPCQVVAPFLPIRSGRSGRSGQVRSGQMVIIDLTTINYFFLAELIIYFSEKVINLT